jgi:lipoate-protein ligase A
MEACPDSHRGKRVILSGVQLIDQTLTTPEENLALDEALLRRGAECLRLWESPSYVVVLGASGRRVEEAHLKACQAEGVPVLRRASGGGTVLLGPGCLVYSLVLNYERRPLMRDLSRSNQLILARTAAALGQGEAAGISDLVLDGMKFCGTAQRRLKHALLFHATILYDFDLERIPRLLQEPKRQPDYRGGRPHLEFVRNLGMTATAIRSSLAVGWGATETPEALPDVDALVHEKYGNPDWIQRL